MKNNAEGGTSVYKIRLRDDADRAEFERVMEQEVLDSSGPKRNGASFDDELYAHKLGRQSNGYIWIISRDASQFGGPNQHVDIDDIFNNLKEKVEAFGEVTQIRG